MEQFQRHLDARSDAELIHRLYEKVRHDIGVFNGHFRLADTWQESSGGRNVFKFRLEVDPEATPTIDVREPELEQNRMIPTSVKLEVWKRDRGRCVI